MTPSGIFQGRDASCCNLHDVLGMGLHDYTVHRTPSGAINRYVDSTPTSLLVMATGQGHGRIVTLAATGPGCACAAASPLEMQLDVMADSVRLGDRPSRNRH